MKIAIVSLQFEETATGGGGVHVGHICEQFLDAGEDVTILSIHTNRTLSEAALEEGDIRYSVRNREDGLRVIRFLLDENIEHPYVGDKDAELDRIKRFADMVIKWFDSTDEKFDVINLHGHHIIPGYMAKELRGKGSKIVSYLHALETTYVTERGDFVGAFNGTKEILARIRGWEAMCRYADFIMVNSPIVREETKQIIKEHCAEGEKYFDRIILLASGCNNTFLLEDEMIDRKLKEIPKRIELITFCRIDPSKGVKYSINGAKAAARLSSYKFCLTITGIPSSDEYIQKLKKETKDLPDNLEINFRFFEAISSIKEKKEILDDKHIYILPTLKEPFGMSLIEASARGLMVVSADTNGPKWMFESDLGEDTRWGIITKRGVLARITNDHDKNLSENVGKAIVWTVDNWSVSREHVLTFNKKIRDIWTWEGIGRHYLELFETGKTSVE